MESISNLMAVTELKQQCPKHHKPLWKKGNGKAICPLCQREKVDAKTRGLVDNWQNGKLNYLYEHKSYWGNPELIKASFQAYKSRPGSKEAEFKERALNLVASYKQALETNDPNPLNVVMSGDAGRGKSFLAACMLKELVNVKYECLFINLPDYYESVKRYWDEGTRPKLTLDKIVNADVVVIDDLGAETGREEAGKFIQDFIYNIFNKRNKTIITTNLTSDEFYQKYNARNVSRMFAGINGKTKDRVFNFEGMKDKRAFIGLF